MFGKIDSTAASSTKNRYDLIFAKQDCFCNANDPLLSTRVDFASLAYVYIMTDFIFQPLLLFL